MTESADGNAQDKRPEKRPSRSWLWVVALLLLAGGAGGGWWWWQEQVRNEPGENGAEEAAAEFGYTVEMYRRDGGSIVVDVQSYTASARVIDAVHALAAALRRTPAQGHGYVYLARQGHDRVRLSGTSARELSQDVPPLRRMAIFAQSAERPGGGLIHPEASATAGLLGLARVMEAANDVVRIWLN